MVLMIDRDRGITTVCNQTASAFHTQSRIVCLYNVTQMENNTSSVGLVGSVGFYTARQVCKISSCVRAEFCSITFGGLPVIQAVAGGCNRNVVDDCHNLYSQCKASNVSLFSRVGPERG